LSLYLILSKVILYQSLEEVQAAKIRSSKLRSHLPKIISGSLIKIFILSNPIKGVGPKFLEEKFSHVFPWSKFLFSEKVSSFVGYTLNWIIIPLLLVFKPFKLLNLLKKGLSNQRVILSVQAKLDYPVSETGLSSFRVFNYPGQNLPLHLLSHFSLLFSQEQL
jgi:hypothetical protein